MPDPHIIGVLVEHEFVALLVDGVVGQVHADVLHVVFVGSHVEVGCETSEAFAEDEYS